MSVFDSRDDDPLLQNDPLAPTDDDLDEASSPDDPPTEEPPSEPSSSSEAPLPANAPDEEEPAPSASEGAHSVFGLSDVTSQEASPPQPEDDLDTRVIVRSAETAAGGRLTTLNSAFEQGWRLDRVELRRPSTDDPTEVADAYSYRLAFVLRRPSSR